VARRVVDVRKAFNIREGWKPGDDTLPARFLAEPLTDGASAGARIPRERLREMIRSYNLARGWTEQGYLPAAALQDLGVDT
jgi:aldehyde:ferredoxin oxidoreductase